MIRQATIADIDRIDQTARKFHAELGWVRKPEIRVAIEHGWLLIDEETGAFVLFRIRKDKVRVINAICVPAGAQRRGLGAQLVNRVGLPIRLKCVAGMPANMFYNSLGFRNVAIEPGRKRKLLVWVKP